MWTALSVIAVLIASMLTLGPVGGIGFMALIFVGQVIVNLIEGR